MSGRLFVVSLPIGNLGDITLRAIETLRAVDAIVAEDTRTTRRVLDHYQIRTPFHSSLYEGAEDERTESLVGLLAAGRDLALVSDAGTPLVSDPGFPLVRAAVAAGIDVVPVPGPCAALAALVASGLPPDRVLVVGSLPRKAAHRAKLFARLQTETATVVAYESSHRLLETLDLLSRELPERDVVVAREVTKLHEEFVRGRAADVAATFAERGDVRGECVLLIGGAADEPVADAERVEAVLSYARDHGLSKRDTEELLERVLGVARNRAYRLAHHDGDSSDRAA